VIQIVKNKFLNLNQRLYVKMIQAAVKYGFWTVFCDFSSFIQPILARMFGNRNKQMLRIFIGTPLTIWPEAILISFYQTLIHCNYFKTKNRGFIEYAEIAE
jgi:hypothetical protein